MSSPAVPDKQTPSPSEGPIAGGRRSNPQSAQLVRFGAVGLLATGIYLVSTHLLQQYTPLSAPVAASVSFIVVVAMNYVLHYSWTFRSTRPHASAVPRFLGTAACGMAINYAAVTLGTRWSSFPQTLVLLFGVALVVGWNYLLSRFWVFVDHRRGD